MSATVPSTSEQREYQWSITSRSLIHSFAPSSTAMLKVYTSE